MIRASAGANDQDPLLARFGAQRLSQRLGTKVGRNHVSVQAVLSKGVGRLAAHHGNLQTGQRSCVGSAIDDPLQKVLNAILAAEDQDIEAIQRVDGLIHVRPIFRRSDLNRGLKEDGRPQLAKGGRERLGLFTRTCHQHRLAEQTTVLDPIGRHRELRHRTQDDDHGWAQFASGSQFLGHFIKPTEDRSLVRKTAATE